MLEWLKAVLGDNYTEDIDKRVSEQIGKEFVSRTDFNAANEAKKQLDKDIKDRDKQLEELKKVDAEGLQKKIEELQETNKAAKETYEANIKQIKIDNAVAAELACAKAKNLTATKALLSDFLKTAELGEDGKVKGLSDQIKTLQADEGSKFLFDVEQNSNQGFKGLKPGESGNQGAPGGADTSKMSYEQMCAYLEANPGAQI